MIREEAIDITLEQQSSDKSLPPIAPTQRWISVNKRLPEKRIAVLVWCPERKNIYCACYEEKQWRIFGAFGEKVQEEVRAWQPLPKTCKAVGDYNIHEGVTNGDMIKAMFPSIKIRWMSQSHIGVTFRDNQDYITEFELDWWNAPYRKE